MYAVEFEAPIQNGVVYIPKEYKDLQEKSKARFLVIYDDAEKKANIKKNKKMNAISIDTIGFRFNREEAHAGA